MSTYIIHHLSYLPFTHTPPNKQNTPTYLPTYLPFQGLVLKSLKKPYMPVTKSRQLGGWTKLKPDYGDSIEDIDLVLIGGYYREGDLWSG